MSAPRRLPAWRDDDDHAARRAMVRRRAAIRRRDLAVTLDRAAGSVSCPQCHCRTAIDRCWNCGARYSVTFV